MWQTAVYVETELAMIIPNSLPHGLVLLSQFVKQRPATAIIMVLVELFLGFFLVFGFQMF